MQPNSLRNLCHCFFPLSGAINFFKVAYSVLTLWNGVHRVEYHGYSLYDILYLFGVTFMVKEGSARLLNGLLFAVIMMHPSLHYIIGDVDVAKICSLLLGML